MSISVLRVHEKKRRKMENLKEISALEMKVEALRLKNDLLKEEINSMRFAIAYLSDKVDRESRSSFASRHLENV